MSLSGKVALITGAVGGIGAPTAHRFVRDGAKVALLDVDEPGLRALAEELGESASWHCCDVSDDTSMAEAVKAAAGSFGKIDVGVLNAGIAGKRRPLANMEVQAFDKVMAVNTRGVFLGLKHLFPVMRQQDSGSVVITASTEGLRGNAGLAAYVASKHAVIGLARTAALEWAVHNIRVNCVNPAPVDTPMMHLVEKGMIEAGVSDVRERNTSRIPLRRYATPDEVANFITFLASDEASFSTGGTYLVDGGVMAGKFD